MITPNLPLPLSTRAPLINDFMLPLSWRKLGVIMGDNVMTGINTSIYPGTVIESGFRGLPAAICKGLVFFKREG
jgi:hypothetical protein